LQAAGHEFGPSINLDHAAIDRNPALLVGNADKSDFNEGPGGSSGALDNRIAGARDALFDGRNRLRNSRFIRPGVWREIIQPTVLDVEARCGSATRVDGQHPVAVGPPVSERMGARQLLSKFSVFGLGCVGSLKPPECPSNCGQP
jgi:hypothetical protein